MHYERRGLMQPLQRETTAGPACRLRWVRSVVIARARACAASMAEAKYSLSQCYYFEVTVEKELHRLFGRHGNRAPGFEVPTLPTHCNQCGAVGCSRYNARRADCSFLDSS